MTIPYLTARRAEYQAIEDLKAAGYQAQRTAGSHSPFDIIAWDQNGIRLIQVKRATHFLQISQAINQARAAWPTYAIPRVKNVAREVWVRFRGGWLTWNLATDIITLPATPLAKPP